MTDEPARSRRELWDERHAAQDPIESHDPAQAFIHRA